MKRLFVLSALLLMQTAGDRAAHAANDGAQQPEVPAAPRVRSESEPWAVAEGLRWDRAFDAARAAGKAGAAPGDKWLGLLPGGDFGLATGRCPDCQAPDAALRYFREEIIAVPRVGRPISGQVRPGGGQTALPYPPLVWIGAPELLEGALISADGRVLRTPDGPRPLALAPPIPTNQAYLDRSTLAFLDGRRLRVRGVTLDGAGKALFVARTIWPEDTRIVAKDLSLRPLRHDETLATLVRAQAGASGETYDKRLLWERRPGEPRDWAGRPVLAFVLNGAQGDDDGAHGGHLGVAAGWFGPGGEWGDWLVSNFYPLDERSEKGIVSAPVPMDNYMMDLNSGQAFYRPSYLLVAVFREPDVPVRVQAALQDIFYGYWCGRIEYYRGRDNSTAMSIDALRELGWRIPEVGVTSRLLGLLAFPVAAVMQRSLSGARFVFDLFVTEKTRLVPRVAFEEAGHDLLRLVQSAGEAGSRELTPLERRLAEDVEAVLFLRFPQVPSSRPLGTYPVASLLEYAGRVPWRSEERASAPEGGRWPFAREPDRPCPSPEDRDDGRR